jgi:hypothetical protein
VPVGGRQQELPHSRRDELWLLDLDDVRRVDGFIASSGQAAGVAVLVLVSYSPERAHREMETAHTHDFKPKTDRAAIPATESDGRSVYGSVQATAPKRTRGNGEVTRW